MSRLSARLLVLATLCSLFVCWSSLRAAAQGNGFTVTQIPNPSNADRRWPAIDNDRTMVWCEFDGSNWQVVQGDINGHTSPKTSDAFDHKYPSLKGGHLLYAKHPVGGGIQWVIVEHPDSIVQFSSRDRLSGAHRDAGRFSAVATDGTIATWYDWFPFAGFYDGRRLEISGYPRYDFFEGFDHPDINSGKELIYSDGSNIYKATAQNPGAVTRPGAGAIARINDNSDIAAVIGSVDFQGLVTSGSVVLYKAPDYATAITIHSGIWTSISNRGDILFEDVDAGGHHQIYLAQAVSLITPVLDSVTNDGSTKLDLAWTETGTSQDGFEVERKSGSGGWLIVASPGPADRSLTDTGLVEDTTYTYRIRAFKGSGSSRVYSDYSNTRDGTTGPKAPTQLRVTTVGSTKLDLTWVPQSTTQTRFEISRKIVSGTWSVVGTVPSSATSYHDTGLTPETKYTYEVRAVRDPGALRSDPSNDADGMTGPPAPSGLRIWSVYSDRLKLKWKNNTTSADHIEVERKDDVVAYAVLGSVPGTETRYTDASVAKDTTYTYRVRAFKNGNPSDYSDEASGAPEARKILLVHGTWSNGKDPWPELRSALGTPGDKYLASAIDFNKEPETLSNEAGGIAQAHAIGRYVRNMLHEHPDRKIDLVCHSFGGLAARWYLRDSSLWPASDNPGVEKLILIGTPNWGTDLELLNPILAVAVAHEASISASNSVGSTGFTIPSDTIDNWSPILHDQFGEWMPPPVQPNRQLPYDYPATFSPWLAKWSRQRDFVSPITIPSRLAAKLVAGVASALGDPGAQFALDDAMSRFPIYQRALLDQHVSYYNTQAISLGAVYVPSPSGGLPIIGVNTRRVSAFLATLNSAPEPEDVDVYLIVGTGFTATIDPLVPITAPFTIESDSIVPKSSALGIEPIRGTPLFPAITYSSRTLELSGIRHTSLEHDLAAIQQILSWLAE